MKKLYGIIITLIISSSFPSRCDVMEYANGRAGTALKNALRIHCAPETYKSNAVDAIVSIYSISDDMVIDGISNHPLDKSQSDILQIIPAEWMTISPVESSRLSMDLYNMAPTDPMINIDRKSFPFANVTEPQFQHGDVAIGYSTFRNDMIEAIEPNPEVKGDIARAIFYVTTIYPVSMWTDWGGFFFENNPYPTLSKEAAELYLKWHREDPVDEQELNRCDKIKSIQGNINPFVTNPEIAEYLWGDKIGKAYGDEASSLPVPEPLKAVYSKSADATINLHTPYLSDDTKWWLDNNEVSKEIPTASISEGKHELKFRNSTVHGKLLITIKP